jgi:hypothetical protein
VVAVHVRLDDLVSSFLAATSLKALGGVGCGDQGSLFSDTTFCYLIDHRARVLVHPALLTARAAGRPLQPIMEAMRRPRSDLLRDFGELEPIMADRLLAADIFVYVRGTKGNSNFRFVSVNHSALQEYSEGTRNSPPEQVSSSKWPQLKSVPLQSTSTQEWGRGGGSGRGPARPPQGAGVLFTIPGVGRDTDVYFHHLADTRMYLVVATDYVPPSVLPFCGALSQLCPHVIQPLEHVDLKRKETCSEDASETDIVDDAPNSASAFDTAGSGGGALVGLKGPKNLSYNDMEQAKVAAGFYRTPTSFLALQAMREHYKHKPVVPAGAASSSAVIEDDWLKCSYFNPPTWILPAVIVFGVLLILTCFACRRRRTKLLHMAGAQQAIKNVQENELNLSQKQQHAASVTMVDADNDGVVTYDELLALAATQGQGEKGGLFKKMQALQGRRGELDDRALEAFRLLQQLQAKISEDLWTRDTGTTAQLEAQIHEISSQVREIRGQFDFLQQRVQDQDVKSDTLILHQRKCLYVPRT